MEKVIQVSEEARKKRQSLKRQAMLHEAEVRQARSATRKAEGEAREAQEKYRKQTENPRKGLRQVFKVILSRG